MENKGQNHFTKMEFRLSEYALKFLFLLRKTSNIHKNQDNNKPPHAKQQSSTIINVWLFHHPLLLKQIPVMISLRMSVLNKIF